MGRAASHCKFPAAMVPAAATVIVIRGGFVAEATTEVKPAHVRDDCGASNPAGDRRGLCGTCPAWHEYRFNRKHQRALRAGDADYPNRLHGRNTPAPGYRPGGFRRPQQI